MTQYDDFFMRDSINDTGQVPDLERAYWTSPDIIPWGPSQAGTSDLQDIANWSLQWNRFISSGQLNYIYVRASNLCNGAETGTVQLYWAPSSLLLNSPQWISNQITPASGTVANLTATAQNQVAVGDAPFQWTPPARTDDHFCLIAIVGTPNHPAPMPPSSGFASSEDFATWVVDNPSVAQRNVTVVSYPPPPTWQQTQTFANLDSDAQTFLFNVDIGGLPIGTTGTLTCSSAEPSPAIQATAIVKKSENPAHKGLPEQHCFLSAVTMLPAGFSSSVVFTLNVPAGSTSPPLGGITIRYGVLASESASPSRSLLALSRTVAEIGGAAPHVAPDFKVVILGSCRIAFVPAPPPAPSPTPTADGGP